MKIVFECYEIVCTHFLFEFSFSMEDSMEEKKRWRVFLSRAEKKRRCECVNALTCEWNGQTHIYTHRNFIHGLRTEKAFASITIARREPRGDWNTRIFVELFFSFFFFLHREKVEKLHDTKLKRFLRARRIKLISNPTFHFRPAAVLFSVEELLPTSFLRFLFFSPFLLFFLW